MLKNILVPLDGSDTAEVVLPIAKGFGQDVGGHITLVRVVDVNAIIRSMVPATTDVISGEIQRIIDDTVQAEIKDAEAYLAEAAAELRKAKVDVATQVRQGSAGEELLEAIEAEDVDAAAIATHGRSGVSRTIFGSVADQLIRESGKPVIVVKAG